MKIGIIASNETPLRIQDSGGQEKVTVFLVRELLKRGHEVVTLCKEDSDIKGTMIYYDEIQPKTHDNEITLQVGNILSSVNNLLEYDLDIIHDHSSNPLLLILNNFLEIPVIKTFHEVESSDLVGAIKSIPGRFNQICTAVTASIREEYLPYVEDIKIIPNGIDVESWKFYAQENPEYLSWTGRIMPGKGITEILNFCIRAKRKLKFAGPIIDPLFYELEIAPLLEANAHISYEGYLNEAGINKIVGSSAGYISSSVDRRSYGISILEALACGTPILATMTHVSKEKVHSDVGVYFDTNDYVSFLDAVKEIRKKSRTACLHRARTLCCHKRMVDGYEAVYEGVYEQKSIAV